MTNETKILSVIGGVTVALIISAVFFLSKPEKSAVIDTSKLVKEDSNKIATDSARLTIVEFGDYQCPACAAAHPSIKKALGDFPGQVNFVFRHFPLAQHKNAELAAASVEAAKLQGKLWEMHDKLYESQNEWEESDALDLFKKYASGMGIDTDKFVVDISSDSVKQKVKNDLADGLSLGINSTPTFYFNGELYKKGISYEDFRSEIESRLK